MTNLTRRTALVGPLSLFIARVAEAKTATPETYVDAKTRDIIGGRKVLIVMSYDKLQPGVDSWNLGAAYFAEYAKEGIDHGLVAHNRPKIAPIVTGLDGYDFNRPMAQALTDVARGSSWLHAQDTETTKAGRKHDIEAALDASNTRQMLLLDADFLTDYRFTSIIVSLQASMLVRQVPKGQRAEARLNPAYIPYQHTIRSIVSLPDPDLKTYENNVPRWAADDARLARAALDIGIQRVPALLARNLEETEAQADVWRKRNDRKTVTRAFMDGWVVGRQDAGVLFVDLRQRSMNYLQTLDSV